MKSIPAMLLLSPMLFAQGPADGLRMFGAIDSTDTFLFDVDGNVVHMWRGPYFPGLSVDLEADGTLLRAVDVSQISAGGAGGGVHRMTLDGTITWDFRYNQNGKLAHHDLEPLPNGNVLVLAWEEKTHADTIAQGRNPVTIAPGSFRPDHIVEVQQTGPTSGAIVWEWHVWDHMIQDFDSTKANYGVVGDHPELIDLNYPQAVPSFGDWNHCNSIDYDPENEWILISSRNFDEIWVIDHSTTTAEAAGHTGGRWGRGGDILYRWGNPQAYRAGGPSDQQTFGQHDAQFIKAGRPGAGNVTLYDNRYQAAGTSRVIELELPLDASGNFILDASGRYGPTAPVWEHSGTFNSTIMSGCERLPNGNTLICSGQQGLVHEVTPGGQTVWQSSLQSTIFHARFVDRALWSDTEEISLATGGRAEWDIIVGSQWANAPYLVVGSSSGTAPGMLVRNVILPLNQDGYMLTSVTSANSYPFRNTAGRLDGDGRASAAFTLPGGVLPPQLIGLRLDHACVVFEPITPVPMLTSVAVPLTLTP